MKSLRLLPPPPPPNHRTYFFNGFVEERSSELPKQHLEILFFFSTTKIKVLVIHPSTIFFDGFDLESIFLLCMNEWCRIFRFYFKNTFERQEKQEFIFVILIPAKSLQTQKSFLSVVDKN